MTSADVVQVKRDEILAIARKHEDLSEVTGHHVDIVTERGLRARIHDTVLREAKAL